MVTPVARPSVLNAQHALRRNQRGLFRATQRLATGRRINSGKDDPAGLISSEQLKSRLKVLQAETRSLQRAGSFANITEGHAGQISEMVRELKGLLAASANQAGLTNEEIAANQMQVDHLITSIERVRGDAITSLDRFNMPDSGNAEVEGLIDGAVNGLYSLRSGGENSLASGNFDAADAVIDSAISGVATARGQIGAYQRYTVEPRIRSNQITFENLEDSRSRIADADYAVEVSNLTRFKILNEANIQVLKIAQQSGHSVLSLFR